MIKNLVLDAENLKTLEQYGAALILAMISVASLERFETAAFRGGLLNTDEEETSKTICWELRRLMQLYTNQVDQIGERCDLDQEKIIKVLQDFNTPPKKTKPNGKHNDTSKEKSKSNG